MPTPSAADAIMAPAKLKPLLKMSKTEPVQAAMGVTAEGEAVMLLHKTAQPRGVLAMLKQSAGKARIALNEASLRFGRAEVDPAYDPGTIRFYVNKEPPGSLRKSMRELSLRIPFPKVEFIVDALLEQDGSQPEAIQVSEPQAAPQPAATTTPLHDALAALVARIPASAGSDAARLATLRKIAGVVEAKLAANDIAGATQGIAAITQALGPHPAAAPQPAGREADGAAVRVEKGLLLWKGTRSYVDQQLRRLNAAIISASENEPDADKIKANAGAIYVVLDHLDDRLSDKLDALRGTTDAAARITISGEARQIVSEYQAYVANDELMNDIDDNGFVPLEIQRRLTAALQAIKAVI